MNTKYSVLQSREDSSVNFIATGDFPGAIEARYVQREDFYFVVYLTSQTGCKQACRMCHLTATGQTKFVDVTPEQFLDQANQVMQWYDGNKKPGAASIVNFNFMARGEALANPYLLADSTKILSGLQAMAFQRSLIPQYLISTIMPLAVRGKKLIEIFPVIRPEIYYSIYSVSPKFRKRWLPKSLPVEESLDMLIDWQESTGKIPKIHFAFIEGENDSEDDIAAMCKVINDKGLKVNINIVRYNPYSEKQGRESSEEVIQRNSELLQKLLPESHIKTIKRVGFDVKASCGMFIEK